MGRLTIIAQSKPPRDSWDHRAYGLFLFLLLMMLLVFSCGFFLCLDKCVRTVVKCESSGVKTRNGSHLFLVPFVYVLPFQPDTASFPLPSLPSPPSTLSPSVLESMHPSPSAHLSRRSRSQSRSLIAKRPFSLPSPSSFLSLAQD